MEKQILGAAILATALGISGITPAFAADLEEFKSIANKTIKTVKKGKVRDVDGLIEQQKTLIRIGIEAALEFAEKSPADAKMMHLVVLNSNKMQQLSLEDIEKEWHAGGYLRAHGIDIDKFTQADVQTNYYDLIVHPATALIALKKYKESPNPELLTQVENELTEVVNHAGSIKQ